VRASIELSHGVLAIHREKRGGDERLGYVHLRTALVVGLVLYHVGISGIYNGEYNAVGSSRYST
jgi:hypothetical protein